MEAGALVVEWLLCWKELPRSLISLLPLLGEEITLGNAGAYHGALLTPESQGALWLSDLLLAIEVPVSQGYMVEVSTTFQNCARARE